MFPHASSYHSPSLHGKNNRLYQQLLQSNYLSDHIYNPSTNHASPAAIKFVAPPVLSKCQLTEVEINERDDTMMRSPKYNSPFKTSDGTKNSHQITQSLPSNYSIIEIENESHSTINLYNFSRNNLENDVSFSSNNVTAKLHHQNSHLYVPEDSKPSEMLLQGSVNQQQPTLQNISCLESQQKMRKYRSQDYSGSNSKDPINQEENQEVDSPLPKLLANKYIKNEISRKFTISNNGQAQAENFKAVLNQIHVVPYKINQEIQPYAFSIPIDEKKVNQLERRAKANSVNLQTSRHRYQKSENVSSKPLYFSNHVFQNNNQAPKLQFSPIPNAAGDQYSKTERQVLKSEPNIYHVSNQKTARSNSIECKAKPSIGRFAKQSYIKNEHQDVFQLSRVERVYSHQNGQSQDVKDMKLHNQSVSYDQTEINLCCGMTHHQKPTNANRIIFKSKQEPRVSSFCDQVQSVDSTSLVKSKRGIPSKINPVGMIKSYNEIRESESQKKGIKLVGFNSSFLKKNEE